MEYICRQTACGFAISQKNSVFQKKITLHSSLATLHSLPPSRQADNKLGPLTRPTFHVNPPAVVGHDAPTFRKSQTQAAAGLPGGKEWIEDMAALFGRDARPVVSYANHHVVAVGLKIDFNMPTVPQGFQRILTQGPNCHGQLHGVGLDFQRAGIP
jgi:hypothetical protein